MTEQKPNISNGRPIVYNATSRTMHRSHVHISSKAV